MPLLGGRVVSGLTAGDDGNQARGSHHREAAQRQNTAPAADHCVFPSGSSGTLHRGTAYRLPSARVTAAPGGPPGSRPGRQAAGELLVFGVADVPAAGTIDVGLAGISARTSSRIWSQWPRLKTWSRVPSFLTRTAVSAPTR